VRFCAFIEIAEKLGLTKTLKQLKVYKTTGARHAKITLAEYEVLSWVLIHLVFGRRLCRHYWKLEHVFPGWRFTTLGMRKFLISQEGEVKRKDTFTSLSCAVFNRWTCAVFNRYLQITEYL
jgi:hypothetical protein